MVKVSKDEENCIRKIFPHSADDLHTVGEYFKNMKHSFITNSVAVENLEYITFGLYPIVKNLKFCKTKYNIITTKLHFAS